MGGLGDVVVSGSLFLALPIALLAGLVSFASPCILPLVPGYLAYVGGFTGEDTAGKRDFPWRLLAGVLLFIAGFAFVFVIAGFVLGTLGFWFITWRELITRIAGALVIVLGLVFMGRFGFMQRNVGINWRPTAGLVSAPLLGAIFAIGWSPCTGPVLAAISTMSFAGGSAWQGALLAFVYAMGLGLPFVAIALGFAWASGAVAFIKRHLRVINIVGGALLVVIGILMVSGVWNALTLWLQEVAYFDTVI